MSLRNDDGIRPGVLHQAREDLSPTSDESRPLIGQLAWAYDLVSRPLIGQLVRVYDLVSRPLIGQLVRVYMFGFRVYMFLARCTTPYGGVNHGVTFLSPTRHTFYWTFLYLNLYLDNLTSNN